jgi:hypothetical protein
LSTDLKRAAREAFARADQLTTQMERRYPTAWRELDGFRVNPPQPWPEWCLLPMAASAAVCTDFAPIEQVRHPLTPVPIATMAAVYAWRYSRSVYLFHPDLRRRLTGTVPDLPDLDLLAGMPDWCLVVPTMHPEWPGAGLWAHLEADANTRRPELRLLDDDGTNDPVTIPVYLDRPTLTEALADFRATARASGVRGGQITTGQDVHGGALDEWAASMADRVDQMIALVAYLCRPEADIREMGRTWVRPGPRARSRRRGRTVWLVGYGD